MNVLRKVTAFAAAAALGLAATPPLNLVTRACFSDNPNTTTTANGVHIEQYSTVLVTNPTNDNTTTNEFEVTPLSPAAIF
jgi:hypothetical protein